MEETKKNSKKNMETYQNSIASLHGVFVNCTESYRKNCTMDSARSPVSINFELFIFPDNTEQKKTLHNDHVIALKKPNQPRT